MHRASPRSPVVSVPLVQTAGTDNEIDSQQAVTMTEEEQYIQKNKARFCIFWVAKLLIVAALCIGVSFLDIEFGATWGVAAGISILVLGSGVLIYWYYVRPKYVNHDQTGQQSFTLPTYSPITGKPSVSTQPLLQPGESHHQGQARRCSNLNLETSHPEMYPQCSPSVSRKSSSVSKQPSSASRQSSSVSRHPSSVSRHPSAVSRHPSLVSKQPLLQPVESHIKGQRRRSSHQETQCSPLSKNHLKAQIEHSGANEVPFVENESFTQPVVLHHQQPANQQYTKCDNKEQEVLSNGVGYAHPAYAP
ncbi:unnamed protein product [Meganyctiphanes norvegica]|uniref:Uncharacterized protein n=1 Tax=Meganyctiphanes norvegica TaxID=48144 RepID=A0AAV2PJ49_MEGNR